MGGSLGSGVLNGAISTYALASRDDPALAIRQVAGERFVEGIQVVEPAGDTGVLHQVVGFEDDMASVYAAADLLVGRGGASTVHEVAVTGIPSILIPWSGAADDHQTDNVRWLSDVGAAVLMTEADLESDPSRLGATIDGLRFDDEARGRLGAAAAQRGEVHRSGALASLIERVALASSPR